MQTAWRPPRASAGRIIILRGEVVAVDGTGSRRALSRGSPVFQGDTLFTQKGAEVQLRFTDGALVSLLPESRFRIDAYRYDGEPGGQDRAFFSLLKGGLRSITGMIGARRHQDYKVETPVATIGKRGTHYALHLCTAGACVASEGLADGLYGGVLEGVVEARTDTGLGVFGTDEYFHVSGRDADPQPLFQPPAVLSQAAAPPLGSQAEGRDGLPPDAVVKRTSSHTYI